MAGAWGAMRPARRNPALRKDRMARWSHGEGSTWIFVTLAPLNSSSAESPDHFCADTLLAAQLRPRSDRCPEVLKGAALPRQPSPLSPARRD
jgi:hypothetical protein